MAWDFIKPMLTGRLIEFLADPDVQALALRAAERAMRVDLDGDGKSNHATECLIADLKAIGKRYYRAWATIAVQAAYDRMPKAKE